MSKSSCEWLKCSYWDGTVCTDEEEFVNTNGSPVCRRRNDAIPKNDIVAKLNSQIAALAAENERLSDQLHKIIGKCACGHYHCPICNNQMEVHDDATYGLFFKKDIDRLTAENERLKGEVADLKACEMLYKRALERYQVVDIGQLEADKKELVNRQEVLEIVDSCFHCYASSFRSAAVVEAQNLFAELIAKHGISTQDNDDCYDYGDSLDSENCAIAKHGK